MTEVNKRFILNDKGVAMSVEDISQTTELSDAVWQVLDDMGKQGQCCCGAAKAKLRIAFEPFIDENADMADIITLEDAQKIMEECR